MSLKTLSHKFKKAFYSSFYSQEKLNAKFLAAARNNDEARMDILVSSGASPDVQQSAALVEAVANGSREQVRHILNLGADIHAGNEKPLRTAMEKRDAEMVLLLIEKGANPDAAVAYAQAPGYDPVALANLSQWYEKAAPHIQKIVRQQRAVVKSFKNTPAV